MLTPQDTIPGTVASYWINDVGTGSWTTAKRSHVCTNFACRRCIILPGRRYLDTGEIIGEFKTAVVCELHANALVNKE